MRTGAQARVVTRLILILAPILSASCAGSSNKPAKGNTPTLKIAVFSDGRLLVEGQPSTLLQLRESLQRLSEQHGAVWYYREAAGADPPPIAMDVLKEVVALQLPIRLSTKPDYSDNVGQQK